ncbi:imidazole glycerol phosphate synthase subunit HisH [Herbaspirillum seropedicae]|uniref:imidazole glycerol phosphate synthase subunit HisH n=1 Tax=Herbaspirillum seropedicae TaxID=964 RepID=UPI0008639DBC|nr:imidazole glycerol phosphate synthase subunit HisH [Herbaspirillum seropedicae]AON56548.1 imidazole glycerol phosphate synthase subunit HisH [Herbaspirillum seropedicae]MDR6395970.1 imidazole glycerol phosphate synthase glutamine amidotransferase subunit [Herbaspirillum seropedicae]
MIPQIVSPTTQAPISVAIVDYGMGNQASVANTLRRLGYRVKLAASPEGLDQAHLLVLPGVGAFPAAMQALHQRGLVDYLQEQARQDRPILGICLGMQLLAEASAEHGHTNGLGLIPGQFLPFGEDGWHIGWNTIACRRGNALVQRVDGEAVYFNHSFHYHGPEEFQLARAGAPRPCAAIIGHRRVVGIQFHPEKSQAAGRILLQDLINGLIHA